MLTMQHLLMYMEHSWEYKAKNRQSKSNMRTLWAAANLGDAACGFIQEMQMPQQGLRNVQVLKNRLAVPTHQR